MKIGENMQKAKSKFEKISAISKKNAKKIKTNFWQFLHDFFETAKRPDMRILPGNLAFFIILSIPPLLTLIGTFCSLFSKNLLDVIENLSGVLPVEIQNIFLYFLKSDHSASATFIYFLNV